MKMNTVAKERLLHALKSGNYKEGKGVLRTTNNEYCCLGVACDITKQETELDWNFIDEEQEEDTYTHWEFYNNEEYMPRKVAEYWGIDPETQKHLASLNDSNDNWDKVIEYIEKEL